MSPACQLQMTLPGDFRGVFGVTVRLMSDRGLSRPDWRAVAKIILRPLKIHANHVSVYVMN